MAGDRRVKGDSFQIFGDNMHSGITSTQPFSSSNSRDNAGPSGHGTTLGFSSSNARDNAGPSRHGTPLSFSSSHGRDNVGPSRHGTPLSFPSSHAQDNDGPSGQGTVLGFSSSFTWEISHFLSSSLASSGATGTGGITFKASPDFENVYHLHFPWITPQTDHHQSASMQDNVWRVHDNSAKNDDEGNEDNEAKDDDDQEDED
ncbi:hypothetical protein ACH5RR_003595 [Cinchona calisaya]|uniref:Uncharacterized protein n=1 Tax=Cinchona calisaya TaxID=153742 RepID=A0ABD3AVB3_9GENT